MNKKMSFKYPIFLQMLFQFWFIMWLEQPVSAIAVSVVGSCTNLYTNLNFVSPNKTSKVAIPVIIKTQPSDIHAGNYVEAMANINYIGRSLTFLKGVTLAVGMTLDFPGEKNGLLIDEISADGNSLVMRGLLGTKRFFKREARQNVIELVEVSEADSKIHSEHLISTEDILPKRNFDFRQYDSETLVNRLVISQVNSSDAAIKNAFSVEHLKSVITGNRKMIKILTERRDISIHDLEEINLDVTSGTIANDSQNIDFNLLIGIVRGTEPRIVSRNGQDYLVDIRGLQMQAGDNAHFIPASEVLSNLTELIKKINEVDGQTSLYEILVNYRNFLIIHPFVDGNGRTARILLDYMLLRGGFPPAQHDINTRNILYYTSRETYLSFIQAHIAKYR